MIDANVSRIMRMMVCIWTKWNSCRRPRPTFGMKLTLRLEKTVMMTKTTERSNVYHICYLIWSKLSCSGRCSTIEDPMIVITHFLWEESPLWTVLLVIWYCKRLITCWMMSRGSSVGKGRAFEGWDMSQNVRVCRCGRRYATSFKWLKFKMVRHKFKEHTSSGTISLHFSIFW